MSFGICNIDNVCHIYSQEAWHEDAFIIADSEALLKLKEAISDAIRNGQSSCTFFVNDGEGFDLVIKKLDDPTAKCHLQVPYTDPIASSANGLCPTEVIDYGLLMQEKESRRAKYRLINQDDEQEWM